MSTTNGKNTESELSFAESSLLSGFRGIVLLVEYLRTNSILSLIFKIIKTSIQLWLTSATILWSSAFIYSMFYYIYIPLVSISKEVHLQYDSTCYPEFKTKCEIPFAQIPFQKSSKSVEFSRGQMYVFAIDLRLPESDVNWNQGMFMIRIKLFDENNRVVMNVAKPSIIRFKSWLTRIINTLFYWPLLVIGVMDEFQTTSVTLIEDFVEGSYLNVGSVTHARIEIEARNIQISPPTILRISAHLTGLRYYMYYWPITSASVGISTIAFFIYFLILVSRAKNSKNDVVDDENDGQSDNKSDDFDEHIDGSTNICDSGLNGDVQDQSESESDESSTLVIHQIDNIDIHNEDSNPVPDSSVG